MQSNHGKLRYDKLLDLTRQSSHDKNKASTGATGSPMTLLYRGCTHWKSARSPATDTPNQWMEHSKNSTGNQARPFKPTLDFREDRRRSKLHAVLRDVRRVLDYDGAAASAEISRFVTLSVAEIATIERVNNPAGALEYVALIEGWLRIDPWDALALWRAHAVAPIQSEATRWAAHVEQATRKAEPAKFHHAKLVEPVAISAALGLTRARMREVFGTDRCALKPVKIVESAFTPYERAEIRELAQKSGYTKRWIKELALREGGEVAFCDLFLAFELSVLPANVLDRHRSSCANMSDRTATRFIKRFRLHAKPGPKPQATSIELQVAKLASEKRWSVRNTYRKIAVAKAVRSENDGSKNVEVDVRLTVNSCQVGSEFVRSVTSTFSDVFQSDSDSTSTSSDTLDGGGYTDTELAIAAVAMAHPRASKKRKTYNPDDIEILTLWYKSERGRILTPDTYYQWTSRGIFDGHLNTARRWQSKQEFLARELESDAAVAHVTKHAVEIKTDARSTRPVRGPETHFLAAPLPYSKAAGNSHDGG